MNSAMKIVNAIMAAVLPKIVYMANDSPITPTVISFATKASPSKNTAHSVIVTINFISDHLRFLTWS